ncbi:UNVERIFIED_CONTAM: hypothetical protein FKN15_024338 [Acipenser sinensis]
MKMPVPVPVLLLLCLSLGPVSSQEADQATPAPAQTLNNTEEESDWGIGSVRGGFEAVSGYFDSFLELLGGRNGVCQYRCRFGKAPLPRPDYKSPEPNGCSSYFLGLQLDLGIPAMTKCCNQLDLCYDTCGANKYRCDTKFRWCLYGICSDLKKSLGFVSKIDQVKQDLSRRDTELLAMQTKLETLTNQFSDSKQHIEVLKESLTAKEQRSAILQTEVRTLEKYTAVHDSPDRGRDPGEIQ